MAVTTDAEAISLLQQVEDYVAPFSQTQADKIPPVVTFIQSQPGYTGSVGPLAGTTLLHFSPSATIRGGAPITATIAVKFVSIAVLASAPSMIGRCAMVLTPHGTISSRRPITGTSALTFSSTAILAGGPTMLGRCTLTFADLTTLTGLVVAPPPPPPPPPPPSPTPPRPTPPQKYKFGNAFGRRGASGELSYSRKPTLVDSGYK